jgi:uncharacterized protein with HEPN domain
MSLDVLLYLEDILQSVRKIIRYTAGIDYAHFCQDDRT